MRSIAEDFSEIFGRHALPSVLVTEWLHSLGLREHSFLAKEADTDEITESIVRRFGNTTGVLPGTLALRRSDVQVILHDALCASSDRTSPSATRERSQPINIKRLFGTAALGNNPTVLITPIPVIFEKLCKLLGLSTNDGWYRTAQFSVSGTPTVITCPPPGNSMAEDCLQFLSTAAGNPQSVLFLGFAGSLDLQLSYGDIVSPTYVWTENCSRRRRLVSAIPVDLGWQNHNPIPTWTVRSIQRITDESKDLLKAWQWAGIHLIDLESSSIASFCDHTNTPFSMILVISDNPLTDRPIWCRPPVKDDVVLSASVERAVAYAREILANQHQHSLKGAQTYAI